MKKSVSRTLAMALATCMAAGTLAACGSSGSSAVASSAAESTADSTAASTESGTPDYSNEDPINIRIYLSDNATLPYKEDWLTFTEVQKRCNVNLDVEAIPIADYSTKVSLALNTGENVPDVILYQTTTGENASLALNGALVPISDYSDWTPNFNARVEEMGLQDDVDMLNLQDGKRYYMPSLTDKPFYDGGLILREDYLESKGLEAPKTFDDLYEILKAYKADYPDSYPLTILAGPRVLFRMTLTMTRSAAWKLPARSTALNCRCMHRWKAPQVPTTSPSPAPVPASCSPKRLLNAMISSALSAPSMKCSTLRRMQNCGAWVLKA